MKNNIKKYQEPFAKLEGLWDKQKKRDEEDNNVIYSSQVFETYNKTPLVYMHEYLDKLENRKNKAEFDLTQELSFKDKQTAIKTLNEYGDVHRNYGHYLDKDLYPELHIFERQNLDENKKLRIGEKYKIPYIPEDEITLTIGKNKGTKLSTNMLDSLAKYGAYTGIPIEAALGIASRETTFGNDEGYTYDNTGKQLEKDQFRKNKGVLPQHLINYEQAYKGDTSYATLLRLINEGKVKAIDWVDWADQNYKEPVDRNPLIGGFLYFKSGKYNPEKSNYNQEVIDEGKIVMSDPPIKKWWEDKGHLWYKSQNNYGK